MYIRKRDASLVKKTDADADYEEDLAEWKDEAPNFLRSKSNIERIEELAGTTGGYTDRAVQLMVAQDPGWIDREALKSVIEKQQQRVIGCLSLPFSLAFFMLFAFSVFMHEDITMVYVIESGLRTLLRDSTNLEEVESIPDVWNWLNASLVPKLFDQTDLLGRAVEDKSQWSWVLMYNQLQGPMVMEQVRSKKEPCSEGDGLLDDMICYPAWTDSSEPFGRENFSADVAEPRASAYADTQNVTVESRLKYYNSAFLPSQGSRRLRVVDTSYAVEESETGETTKFKAFIYPNTPKYLIQEHLNYMYQKGWLDAQSKQLQIKALLLNAEVGRPRLEQLVVTIIFNRGGGIFTKLTLNSLFLVMYPNSLTMLSDAIWVGFLLFITGKECFKIVKSFKDKQRFGACPEFMTVLEWVIIIGGWFCIVSYVILAMLRKSVLERYNEVVDAQVRDVPADHNSLGDDLHSETDNMLQFSGVFRAIVAEYHLVLMFRFFTAFRAQPRLGIVVSTLESSLIDIIHFFIVLMPTFLAYAISGCFIFGRRLEGFSTFEKSIGVCFKMVMEGEYDWQDISLEHYYTALFWTWTFMMLLVLLMLNMVLAIIMDIYTEMRRNAGNSETVWQTLRAVLLHVRYYKQWISNKELTAHLSNMKRLVTRDELQEEFPRMCQAQLDMLISNCDQESEIGGGMGIKDSMKMIMATKFCIDRVDEEMQQLGKELKMDREEDLGRLATYKPANGEDRGWLQEISERMAVQNHRMLHIQWQLQQVSWQWHTVEALRKSAETESLLTSVPMLAEEETGADDKII